MRRMPAVLVTISVLAAGCAAAPEKAIFETDASQLEQRGYQSRLFESGDENEVMRDVIDTLQDLGFMIKNADAGLGTITASRAGAGWVDMTVTVRARGDDAVLVRANARSGARPVEDPAVYQTFFNALQQSTFLSLSESR